MDKRSEFSDWTLVFRSARGHTVQALEYRSYDGLLWELEYLAYKSQGVTHESPVSQSHLGNT